MTYSKFTTRTISTPYQDSGRGGSRVTTIVLHHMASTSLDGVLSMWVNATRDGSANYAIGNEGQVVGAVPEENRSWSLADYAFDAHSITFEIENESTNGWTISAAATEATAHVVADVCARYGIPCDRAHIMGHREVYQRYGVSYATACPGGLNIDAVVARAQQLLSTITASGGAIPLEDDLSAADVKAITDYIDQRVAAAEERFRRESRMRLYKNTVTGELMAASIKDGRYEILAGPGEVTSLVDNGYLEIAAGDASRPQLVDPTRWQNIIDKCPVDIKAGAAAARAARGGS